MSPRGVSTSHVTLHSSSRTETISWSHNYTFYSFYSTYSTPQQPQDIHRAADKVFGAVLTMSLLLGTLANTAAFLYFRSRGRGMSGTTYLLITTNDIIVSAGALPVSVSFLTGRDPGLLFRSEGGCTAWWFLWHIVVRMSIFLVICMCVSRTVALLRPFFLQKIRLLVLAVLFFLALQVSQLLGFYLLDGTQIVFASTHARPLLTVLPRVITSKTFQLLLTSRNMIYVVPAFVVATSCVVSAVLLNKSKQRGRKFQRNLHRSRKKATITILLFALVYGVCNLPMVFEYIVQTAAIHTTSLHWLAELFKFDSLQYYNSTTNILLISVNSAVNPMLYFWRMPGFRRYISTRICRILEKPKRYIGAVLLDQVSPVHAPLPYSFKTKKQRRKWSKTVEKQRKKKAQEHIALLQMNRL